MIAFIQDVRGRQLFGYKELPEQSKPAARQAILDDWNNAVRRAMALAMNVARRNIHAAVNNPHRIKSMVRNVAFIRCLQSNTLYLERHIDDNLCHFLEDGTYIRYTMPMPRTKSSGHSLAQRHTTHSQEPCMNQWHIVYQDVPFNHTKAYSMIVEAPTKGDAVVVAANDLIQRGYTPDLNCAINNGRLGYSSNLELSPEEVAIVVASFPNAAVIGGRGRTDTHIRKIMPHNPVIRGRVVQHVS
jgi:hypothetical protein